MQRIIEKALTLVGQGYLYGAKGQTCTPAFRRQQAQQYPDQADSILGEGARWDGVPVWDCAQLTRAAAKAAGLSLVSGATSQWNKTAWAQSGTIDRLPDGQAAFVFRQGDGKMQHTGLALGDGTCVHARGTRWGVVRESMDECSWTHWALPALAQTQVLWRGVVTAQSGSTVNVRREPGGKVLARLALGTAVEVTGEEDGWCRIVHDGGAAYINSAFVRRGEDWTALWQRINEIEARLQTAGL